MTTTLLFLPSGDAGWRWMRVDDARVVEEGEGLPATDDATIAIAPADAVALHWAELPSRSAAQAIAAARILVAEASAAPVAELHVAVGEGMAERPIAVVGIAAMRDWLATLAAADIDPAAMVPAPMLLSSPEAGFVRAEIAGQGVVRGLTSGFADEARLTDLVTGGVAPETLGRAAIEAALVATAVAPSLDLRQGPFARRRRGFAIDWRLVRRLGWLSLAILSVTLAVDLVRIMRYSFAADAVEAEADTLARQGLRRGETVTDADRQLDERLASVRGPEQGFTATTAAVFAAVRSVQGAEITALSFEANGDLRVGVATEREGQATDLKRAIERAGFTANAGVFQAAAGRVTGEMTVTAR